MKLLPFLDRDNATLLADRAKRADFESEAAIAAMTDSLQSLISKSDSELFEWIQSQNNSDDLATCMASFFQLKLRPDAANSTIHSSIESKLLSKLMLMMLKRLVTSPPDRLQSKSKTLHGLISLPLLMDCAALYYNSNPKIVKRIISQVFEADHSLIASKIPALSHQIASQISLLAEECSSASSKAVVKIGGGGEALAKHSISLITDSLSFLHDMCYTLRSFISCHPAIAPAFMRGAGAGAALMAALADIHDLTLPKMSQALSSLPHSSPPSSIQSHLRLLAVQLLRDSFFVGASGDGEAEKKGEEMMVAVMAAVQSNTDSSKPGSRSFLNDLNRTHELDVSILVASEKRWLALDDAQLDYLLAVLGSNRSQAELKAKQVAATTTAPEVKVSSSSSSSPSNPELLPLISQVRDILPDLGDGFIIACLLHYDKKADLVINHLLEGSLHPTLASLDTTLSSWNQPSSSSASSSSAWANAASNATQWEIDESRRLMESRAMSRVQDLKQPSQNTRKVHKGVLRVLGSVDAATRAMTRHLAHRIEEEELQQLAAVAAEEGEYDDEYDDSFDGLATAGIDALADIEGEEGPRESSSAMASASRGMQLSSFPRAPTLSFPRAPTLMANPNPNPNLNSGLIQMRQRAPLDTPAPIQPSSSRSFQSQDVRAQSSVADSGEGRNSGKGRGKGNKMWIFEGKIYHYAKPGAKEVSGEQEANEALQANEASKLEIHGLGAGGNKGLSVLSPSFNLHPPPQVQEGQRSEEGLQHPPAEADHQDGGGRGGGRGGRGGGGGRGPPNYARKEQNKAAVGNHHRKDRAMKKMGL